MINLTWDMLENKSQDELRELVNPKTRKLIEEAVQKQLISCPKCHGKGEYKVPISTDEWYGGGWESRHCELCYGTGKVTVEFYESIQKASRK